MVWFKGDDDGPPSRRVAHLIVPYTRGRGLEIGCSAYKLYPHFIGLDSAKGLRNGKVKRTDGNFYPITELIGPHGDLSMFADKSLDFVFSSYDLDQLEGWRAALAEWWRPIKVGGHLALHLPHKERAPSVGNPGCDPRHINDFDQNDIFQAMEGIISDGANGFELREAVAFEDSFLVVMQKRDDGVISYDNAWKTDDRKSVLVVRYGAYGDHIMVSSILPELKKQGYRVVLNCDDRGYDVLKHDPNVDEFWMQDWAQVPNLSLGDYLDALGERFDRVLNLSETMERYLLAVKDTTLHQMSYEGRRNIVGHVNYLEYLHKVADVPFVPQPRFYATDEEIAKAKAKAEALPEGPVLLWVLAGSSVHKVWPYGDVLMSWILDNSNITIVTVGDQRSQYIEDGMLESFLINSCGVKAEDLQSADEHTSPDLVPDKYKGRVQFNSNKWTIRDTMAFAEHGADIVLGPETGVLNAVSHREVPKVVMLSHSSFDNLSRDWVATSTLIPQDVSCYPCHQLHFSDEFCPHNKKTMAAMCASSITPGSVFEAIIERLKLKEAA